MRTTVSNDRIGWIQRLDYKKLIVVVFLMRLIAASVYDVFVTVTDKDILLPDSKFYSLRGRYVALVLEGYGRIPFTKDLLPADNAGRAIFMEILQRERGALPSRAAEFSINSHSMILGLIYFIFGYHSIWVRVFNICLSMLSVYLLFDVAKRYFGDLAANLFLLVSLFLPTQFGYSITLSRDFVRVFSVSLIVWLAYNVGGVWVKKLRSRFCC